MSTPVLHVLAGPNGAGKSTFAERVLVPVTGLPFVNADLIAADRWSDDSVEHGYQAAQLAAAERSRLLSMRRSFITETVFSHPSKVDLVRHAVGLGYLVYLHAVLVPVEVSVARVVERVRRGGHVVPEGKIRQRHARLWDLVAQASEDADHTVFYDNTRAAAPFREVARFESGRPVGAPSWPEWAPAPLHELA